MKTAVKPVSNGLDWLSKILSLFASKQISIPVDYTDKVREVNTLLQNDVSGLVNSILDLGISAGSVDFSAETSNASLTKFLDGWLKNINVELRGKIPVGINALAKEYYRERWKGSSFLLLRTIWENRDGYTVPTKLWFVDGKDIVISDNEHIRELGTETYGLRISDTKVLDLPANRNRERVFIQKPYERWSTHYPVPYLIKKGVYYNVKFLEELATKGSNVVGKAMEYLMMMKKGDVELAKLNNSDYVYSEEDLKKIKSAVSNLIDDMKSNGGTPFYTTNFDTELQHLIPEYNKALESGLYAPIERRILAGLGFIEVVEGITSTRRDAIINPRVFVSEVQQAVKDFSSLLRDVMFTMIELNKPAHRKMMNQEYIEIRTSPVKQFFSEDSKDFMRSLYDRGLLSRRTLVELGVDMDFDAEVERRKREKKQTLDETMFPPVVQNQGEFKNKKDPDTKNKDDVPEDKKGPEKKNYNKNSRKKNSEYEQARARVLKKQEKLLDAYLHKDEGEK